MRLRRYFSSFAFETLRDKEMMVTPPSFFNDPFDCLLVGKPLDINDAVTLQTWDYEERLRNLPGKDEDKAVAILTVAQERSEAIKTGINCTIEDRMLEFRRNTFDETCRIACFEMAEEATAESEYRMWDLYTGHAGARIEFEIAMKKDSPYRMLKVKYTDERPTIDMMGVLKAWKDKSMSFDLFKPFLDIPYTKTLKWKDEHECRLFFKIEDCIKHTVINSAPRSFFNFENYFEIKGVDFGKECPETLIEQISMLVKNDPLCKNVQLRRACVVSSQGTDFLSYIPITRRSDFLDQNSNDKSDSTQQS